MKEIEVDGRIVTETKEIAERINEFFINIAESNKKDEKEALKNVRLNEKTMFLYPADKEEISKIIRNISDKKNSRKRYDTNENNQRQ